MAATLQLLTDAQRQRIAQAALTVLADLGVRLTEPAARELLHGSGAKIDGHRVRIPAPLVDKAVQSAPRAISIFDRDGRLAMQLQDRNTYYGAHTDAPDVLDPFTHERRPCREEDVVRHANLIQALPEIHYTTASGLVVDRPAEIGDRVSCAQSLIHCSKPVLAMPVTPEALAAMREMAALAAGGAQALRRRPMLIIYAEPVSPLVHPDDSVRKLLYCAEQEIPVVYSGYAAMGGTAPMSQAAIIAQLCAESLSGLVLHQLQRPGAPFIFGGMASVMDMKTTIFSYGAPEFQRGNTLMAEMAHYFELPNFGTAGTSDAQTFDGQAVLEATSSCLMAALAGAHLIHDVGLLGNATVVMPEMIVATNEIVAMIRRLLQEVPVDAGSLALEVLASAGPGGEFVTHAHTLDHFRDIWYPGLLFRGGAEAWRSSEGSSFEQRVNERTREQIQSHQAPALPEDLVQEIQELAQATL